MFLVLIKRLDSSLILNHFNDPSNLLFETQYNRRPSLIHFFEKTICTLSIVGEHRRFLHHCLSAKSGDCRNLTSLELSLHSFNH